MRRPSVSTAAAALLVATLTLLGGCVFPAAHGSVYLAIDWVYTPQALYFPAFPMYITAGQYIEHDTGYYTGEYIAWDGSYWIADYRIEVDEGTDGTLLLPPDDGDDVYLSMWLYSFGPSIYTDDVVFHSVMPGRPDTPEARVVDQDGDQQDRFADARAAALTGPPVEIVETEERAGRFVFSARFSRFSSID